MDARWKELQRQAHPDKFAAQGAAAQRVAMQWSVRINEAYQRLKDPMRRAAYLCELHGAPILAEDNTAMPAAFLMQQMEWREALEEAGTAAQLDGQVQTLIDRFDVDGFLELFEQYPEHERGRYVACGGGPAIAVMRAAGALGARSGCVLKYGHSGEVSGDYDGVVGYVAAALLA